MAPRPLPPAERVLARLTGLLPAALLADVPRTYVRLGDVLVLDMPASLRAHEYDVAGTWADELRMRSVIARTGHITGELRLPTMRHVWGDPNTETTHVENGIKYRFDPVQVMFSPGNLPERQRVAGLQVEGEIVVDLFAGIGYFTLPLAVHGRPARVIAIEKNPVSYHYLEQNIELNDVAAIVEPRFGDNRDVAPIGQADRVLMGYLPDPTEFLPLALTCLKKTGGSIHYHTVVDLPLFPRTAFEKLQGMLQALDWTATLKESVTVKSYGPGEVHGVLDVEVRARAS
jgi:tRNA wybutosine-synthesizing protein 2